MPALNRIRFVCNDGDKNGVHVKSTLDATHRLDARTHDDISWTDDDLVIIQNKLERPVEILLEAIQLRDGRRAIFRPARQPHFSLVDKELSIVRAEHALTLGPGESCTLQSSEWVPRAGGDAAFPV